MRVSREKLLEVAATILKDLGASEEEAKETAGLLVKAEARGIDTHGLHMLTLLEERKRAGMIALPTKMTLLKDDAAVALWDGGNGLGQVAAATGMRTAIGKARAYGVGLSLVRNTNNIGILSAYSLMAAEEGQVGLILANAAPAMSPWGGAEAMLGTNPLSIAVPGGKEGAVVLDMSASVVARGKIRRAARRKEPIPSDWALDKEGRATTSAEEALQGTILPVGGPKGYGLALAVDLLAGLLSGSRFGQAIKSFHVLEGPTGVGVLALAIDIERFMPRETFLFLVEGYLREIKNSRRAPGVKRIYIPGEIEAIKEAEAQEKGIEISEATVSKLEAILGRYGKAGIIKE